MSIAETPREGGSFEEGSDGQETPTWAHPDLDPTLLLPLHLQGIPFAEDFENRMTRHPFKMTGLKQRLKDDAELRDLLNVAMFAAIAREKDILLYHQARVFQHILWRSFEAMRSFMNFTLLPPSWLGTSARMASLPAPGTETSTSQTDRQVLGAGASNGSPWWKRSFAALKKWLATRPSAVSQTARDWSPTLKQWLATLLTPKGILAIAVVVFAVVTGVSYVEVQTYKEAIEAYKKSADATHEVMTAYEQEKKAMIAQVQKKDEEVAKAKDDASKSETRYLETRKDLDEKKGDITRLERGMKDLEAARKELENKQTNINSVIQADRDKFQKEAAEANKKLGAADAEIKSWREKGTSLENRLRENAQTLKEYEKQLDSFKTDLSKEREKNLKLNLDLSLLYHANVFVDKVRRQASYRSVDKSAVTDALEQFDSAKETLAREKIRYGANE